VAQDFDRRAEEKRLRAELKTWLDVLEKGPEHGRAVRREVLHGPIYALWHSETDTWSLWGLATTGGVVTRILGVSMSEEERAEYNRFSDLLNAASALGPAGFRKVFEGAMSEEDVEAMLSYGSAPTAGRSTTSGDQGPSCPRGDSNTRHAV
jgi:hypothetical protein